MKTLFTSHFGKKHKDRTPVQIASYAPKGWNPPGKQFEPGLVWRNFTRRKEFVGDWRQDYRQQLSEMEADGSLQAIIERIPEGAVLLCWERDPSTCHRTELANYLNARSLAKVTEL